MNLAPLSRICRAWNPISTTPKTAENEVFRNQSSTWSLARSPKRQRQLTPPSTAPAGIRGELLYGVHKLDRLARNLEDHAAVRAALRKAGVQLVSVTESLEDSASGKLVEGILASIAEFYSANLSQEIRKGLDQKAAQGGWATVAPCGYKNVRREIGGRRGESVLEPDEQAPLVVWAFEQYATGTWSLSVLTETLAEKGLRNRLGNPPGISAVHRMLRKPVYAGIVRWKGVERAGRHTPLVSRGLYERVQGMLEAHSTGGKRSWKHDHYLKGALRCADCGARLYPRGSEGPLRLLPLRGTQHQAHRLLPRRLRPGCGARATCGGRVRGIRIPQSLKVRLERVLEKRDHRFILDETRPELEIVDVSGSCARHSVGNQRRCPRALHGIRRVSLL